MKLEEVFDVIYCEGFDYAFAEYSSFTDVHNRKFHELREAFLKARKAFHTWLMEEGLNEDY